MDKDSEEYKNLSPEVYGRYPQLDWIKDVEIRAAIQELHDRMDNDEGLWKNIIGLKEKVAELEEKLKKYVDT